MKILYPQAKPILIDDFRECGFGAWEGKTAKEIAADDPAFARWISGQGKEVTPPGGENGGVFLQRTCAAFEKIVKGLMTSGITSAVIVAHGGTLMSILSAYGLPRARFYDWMTESGCGYSMRITPGLWMRSMVGEVFAKIPAEEQKDEGDGAVMIDLAREAAEKAFGKQKKDPNDG
jgi:alpha-ribazole phosphatase